MRNPHHFATKIIALALLVLAAWTVIFDAIQPQNAHANQGKWARILQEDVSIYADENCTKTLFVLQKSYYVSLILQQNDCYLVGVMTGEEEQFPQVCGYVKTRQLAIVEVTPLDPIYPTKTLVVTADSAEIKLSPQPSANTLVVAANTQQVAYYGTVSSYGKSWHYVRYAGKFGYALAENLSAPNVALHPTPLPSATPPTVDVNNNLQQDVPTNTPTTATTPKAEIVLVVFVVLVALAICLALFLPGNTKHPTYKKDI